MLSAIVLTGISSAGTLPNPPPPPTGISTSSGGSSGGSSGIAKFQPYTVVLNSTDGTTIGNISAVDYNYAKLWAQRNVTIDGFNYTVTMTADMDSVPMVPQMDIISAPLTIDAPLDATNYSCIAVFNITRYSKGSAWSMRAGTIHVIITVPAEALSAIEPNTTVYLVRNDTKRSIINVANPVSSTDKSTTFDTSMWYDQQASANTVIYSLIGKNVPVHVTTTQTPANQTTTEKVGGDTSLLAMGGVLVLGIAIGLIATLLFGKRGKKQ